MPRKPKPLLDDLLRQILSKIARQDKRQASLERELVLIRNEQARVATVAEEINTRCIRMLGLVCKVAPVDPDDELDNESAEKAK